MIEYLLIGLSMLGAGFAIYRTVKNPSDWEKAVDKLRARVEALETETDKLRYRYWSALGDVAWLTVILQRHDIEIPPKPESYKPTVDKYGNISIHFGDERAGGMDINNSSVRSERDILGGSQSRAE